jgi:hypothetical protein
MKGKLSVKILFKLRMKEATIEGKNAAYFLAAVSIYVRLLFVRYLLIHISPVC